MPNSTAPTSSTVSRNLFSAHLSRRAAARTNNNTSPIASANSTQTSLLLDSNAGSHPSSSHLQPNPQYHHQHQYGSQRQRPDQQQQQHQQPNLTGGGGIFDSHPAYRTQQLEERPILALSPSGTLQLDAPTLYPPSSPLNDAGSSSPPPAHHSQYNDRLDRETENKLIEQYRTHRAHVEMAAEVRATLMSSLMSKVASLDQDDWMFGGDGGGSGVNGGVGGSTIEGFGAGGDGQGGGWNGGGRGDGGLGGG